MLVLGDGEFSIELWALIGPLFSVWHSGCKPRGADSGRGNVWPPASSVSFKNRPWSSIHPVIVIRICGLFLDWAVGGE